MHTLTRRTARGLSLACILIVSDATSALAQAPNDETIAFWIGESLREDPRVGAADIDVQSDAGIVTLTGTVRNLAERHYAGLVANKIQGVRGVVNRVEIFTVKRTDADLASEVRQRIAQANPIRLLEITTVVKEGVVTLTGTVESFGQRAEAELVASEVHGVRAVRNELAIRYQALRAPVVIRGDILAALNRDVYLTGLPIDVSVVGGDVTLTGTVGNAYQKERAENECWKTPNVTAVVNQLKVNWLSSRGERANAPKPTDQELLQNVIAALQHEPRVDSSDVAVGAKGGHVTLRGTVPSFYQRQVAEQDTRDVVGTVWVSNLLEVRTNIRPDRSIQQDIQSALATDYVLRQQQIDVRVINGAVSLFGEVTNAFDQNHAAVVAGRVYGVRSVKNHLSVPHTAVFRDAALEMRIGTRLAANWETRWVANRINVDVTHGIATLTGDVDRWSERREAERVAFVTDGVTSVENRLTVLGVTYKWNQWYIDRSDNLPSTTYPGDRWYFFEIPF